MTSTLVLLRHARAEGFGSGGDHLRTLDSHGRGQAEGIGPQIQREVGTPDLVLCSSARRTQQTWQLAAEAAGWDVDAAHVCDELYGAGAHDIADLLAQYAQGLPDGGVHAVALVIGHEPTMSGAARLFAGPGSSDAALDRMRVGVPTASASVSRNDLPLTQWSPGTARLEDLLGAD